MSFVVPAEWAPHKAMWLGFPSHADLWEDNLQAAQAEVVALALALAGPGGEQVKLMTGHPDGEVAALCILEKPRWTLCRLGTELAVLDGRLQGVRGQRRGAIRKGRRDLVRPSLVGKDSEREG